MDLATTLLLVLGLVTALAIGVPIAFTLALVGAAVLYSMQGTDSLLSVPTVMVDSMNDFTLTAVPMFILMGQFLARGGLGARLYNLAATWLRHIPGGLGIATIVSCAVLAAISGSSTAIVAAVGIVALPELTRLGYSGAAATGLVAAGATLGILIPPSIPLIIFSSVTDESTGQLFAAGMLPGLVMVVAFCVYSVVIARRGRARQEPRATWNERIGALKGSLWALLLPVLILGGIYSGAVTATEAGALGTVISAFLALVVYRAIPLKEIIPFLVKSAASAVIILAIVQGALLFGHSVTLLGVPQRVVQGVTDAQLGALGFVLVACVLFIILGCFLEVISIILITLPVLLPGLLGLNVDLVWFAVLMVITMEMGLITPPVGLNLFVIGGVARDRGVQVSQTQIVTGTMPFLGLMLLVLALVLIFPWFATAVPSLLYGGG